MQLFLAKYAQRYYEIDLKLAAKEKKQGKGYDTCVTNSAAKEAQIEQINLQQAQILVDQPSKGLDLANPPANCKKKRSFPKKIDALIAQKWQITCVQL